MLPEVNGVIGHPHQPESRGYNPFDVALTGPIAPWIDNDTQAYIEGLKGTCHHILTSNPPWASPYSFREYVALAGLEALRAAETGNRAVGAVVIWRDKGTEYIFGGYNQCEVTESTHPHAEEVAIDHYEAYRRKRNPLPNHLFITRPTPTQGPSLSVASTLECCVGCIRRIISADIGEAMYAHPDPEGGQLSDGSLDYLAPYFKRKMDELGMRVVGPYSPTQSELTDYAWRLEELADRIPTYIPPRINIFDDLARLDTRMKILREQINSYPPTSFGRSFPELRQKYLYWLWSIKQGWNTALTK